MGSSLLKKTWFWLVLFFVVLIIWFGFFANGEKNGSKHRGLAALSLNDEQLIQSARADSYDAYLLAHADAKRPEREIVIKGVDYSGAVGMQPEIVTELGGLAGAFVQTGEAGRIEWEVEVPEAGLYHIGIRYFPTEGKSSSIERELLIDGKAPFYGAQNLAFHRVWVNEKEAVEQDNRGNDLRPRQIEAPKWQETLLRDVEGYYIKPYSFYLSKGKHQLALESSREPMAIDYIKLYQAKELPSYAELEAQYAQLGYTETSGQLLKIQGEQASYKSSPTLYPISDRSSSTTEPYHVSKVRMNTIGGNNWRIPGDWIAWELEVPEDGLYQIGIKNRQEFLRGTYSTRTLKIDGEIPFEEMEELAFYYGSDWQMNVLGDGEKPYLFYLTKGKHELRLEVSLGQISQLIRQVEASVLELNAMYRKILMITGAVPDPFRDYHIEKQIPNLLEVFREQSKILYGVSEQLEQMTGEKSDKTAVLNKLAYQLEDLAAKPESIQKRLAQYKLNVGGAGSWILSVREQPLEIDYLIAASPDVRMPRASSTALQKVKHEVSTFAYSFLEDYNTIGDIGSEDQSVTVWIGTGRDQAQVLKAMIDDTFTPVSGISVNLKLVQMDVLLRASLSGEGPDVAMQIENDVPVNFGMRNAAIDLRKFDDFDEVVQSFRESALVPYEFDNKVFALPEQQTFSMLFYRKDILEELGLEPPQTWDDLYTLIPVLQKHHMELALPIAQTTGVPVLDPNKAFAMLLYQMDGEFYEDAGKTSALASDIAMNAFRQWTDFYTSYKFPLIFDFPTRFRTGEMPIGIQDYTFYNYLTVSAPEIKGLWDFIPVPGIKQEDGTIRREVASSGKAVIMLNKAKDQDASWEFMKWWVSKDTQVRFGREMEGLMGAAARYPTANIDALMELPWPAKDYKNLESQWQWVRGIPEVPGGYFTGRHLDNAFREVINNGTNTIDSLYDYVQEINYEISQKRDEFNLD